MPAIKFFIRLLTTFILFYSCQSNSKTVYVVPYELLHDNSSKVWILNSQTLNGIDKTPENREDKWVITFFSDKTFVLSLMKDFADFSPYQGKFELSNKNEHLIFYWNNGQVDENNLITLNQKSLIYQNLTADSDTVRLHFVPINKAIPASYLEAEIPY